MSAALPAALNAASTAEEIYALGEALLHYERALEVWEEADRPVAELPFDRTEVMRRAAQAANLTGDTERAIAYARAALTRVEKDGQTAEAALAHERLGRYLWTAGRGDDALPEYSLAVELMPDDPPSEERALVVAAEAQALMLCNLHAESSPLCEEALTMARSVGSQRIEANVLNTISANCAASGYFEQAVATAGDALALARDLNLGEEVCRSYTNGGDALHQAGELQRSIAAAHEGIRMAAHFGIDRQWGDFLRAELAGRLLHVGRWQEAEELLNAIVEHAPRGVNAGNTYAHFGHLLARQGSFEKACEMLARADENIAGSGTAMWLAPPAAARAVLELWAGHPENAIALVTDCLDRISGREHPFFSARLYGIGVRAFADLAARAPGDQQIRRRQAGRAEALIDRLDSLTAPLAGTWPLISASRAECAAELARVAGRSNADLWAYAAEAWQAADDPYVAAYARWREAEALLEVDARRKRAVPLVRDAASVATRLGARPLVEELEGLARRAGIDLRQHTGTETPNPALAKLELTPRELEVLALLGDGMTNREIASELFISHKTASVHVSRILSKLSVTNRAAAAAAAQRLGVVGAGMSGRPSNPRVPRDPDL
jgi:DNA-binding CsgD family transcriptional regulator